MKDRFETEAVSSVFLFYPSRDGSSWYKYVGTNLDHALSGNS